MYNHEPKGYICPFCLIAKGIENENLYTKQDDIVYKDDYVTAFIASGWWKNNKGHVIIIPNKHIENLYDLPSELSHRIHDIEKEIALAFKEMYKCDGVSSRQHNEPSGNQDVWHYHLHVFPRYKNDDLYKADREDSKPEERIEYAEKIRNYFKKEALFLTEPVKKYQNSFQNYALAYRRIKDEHYFNKYKKALENFQDYLNDLYNYSDGKNLLEGEVATSIFWLIYKNEVVGVVRIRHQEVECAGHIGYDISPDYRNKGYGLQILKLALEKAIKIGLKEVILTCNVNNTASRKVIEKNNGKLLGTIFDEEENEHLYKYSITLTTD